MHRCGCLALCFGTEWLWQAIGDVLAEAGSLTERLQREGLGEQAASTCGSEDCCHCGALQARRLDSIMAGLSSMKVPLGMPAECADCNLRAGGRLHAAAQDERAR